MRQSEETRAGFTLVELLVVITIIGILASVLIVAASAAVRSARQARIRVEMTQLATALEDYNNQVGSYPPNAQTDNFTADNGPIDENRVLANFRRHFNKAFPSHREPETLIRALCGVGTGDQRDPVNPNLPGGMNAAESIVFWLGVGSDPQYPISGPGGPSYVVTSVAVAARHEADPVEGRDWRLDLNVGQLGPRREDGFFAGTEPDTTDDSDRFIIYNDPRVTGGIRRINFWQYQAAGTAQPYAYFDTSRQGVTQASDAPASSLQAVIPSAPDAEVLTALAEVFAIKAPGVASGTGPVLPRWANNDKFQILHCGLDEAWGVFPRVDATSTLNPNITYRDGPWTLDLRDTLAHFVEGTLEDAQP